MSDPSSSEWSLWICRGSEGSGGGIAGLQCPGGGCGHFVRFASAREEYPVDLQWGAEYSDLSADAESRRKNK